MKIEIERGLVEHAIEALEAGPHASILMNTGGIAQSLRTALREALAAPQPAQDATIIDGGKTAQEPYAYVYETDGPFGLHRSFDPVPHNSRLPARTVAVYTTPQPAPQQEPDALHLAAMDLARKQAQRIADLESEIAGLESGASHLSVIIDELRSLLVEVDDVFGKDGYGFPFEDGDSALIDRIRSRIESIAEPAPQLAAQVPLTDEQMHEVRQTSCVQLLDLAKQWADNKIHVYQFTNEAEKIITAVARRVEAAHGIQKGPQ